MRDFFDLGKEKDIGLERNRFLIAVRDAKKQVAEIIEVVVSHIFYDSAS